jgi:prepilin-type N-terminal cleavage/methylation domain-containing protein
VTTAAARSERGDTLIEVLVSVVILGLAITAFLLGMTTSIGSSSIVRGQATGETLLISAGQVVQDQNINPYSCANLATLQQQPPRQGYRLTVPGGPWPPNGWRVAITDVEYWDPQAGPPLNPFGLGAWVPFSTTGNFPSCPVGTAPYVQGLTITVTNPGAGGDVSLSRMYTKVAPP